MRSRLSTIRGIAATIITVLIVISGVSGGKEPAVALSALLIISPVIWWLSWWGLTVLHGIGNVGVHRTSG